MKGVREKLNEMKKVTTLNFFLLIIVSRSGRSLASQRSMRARIQGRRNLESQRVDSHADYITAADHPSTGSKPNEQKARELV